jgi:hypothetical protein
LKLVWINWSVGVGKADSDALDHCIAMVMKIDDHTREAVDFKVTYWLNELLESYPTTTLLSKIGGPTLHLQVIFKSFAMDNQLLQTLLSLLT